MMRLGNQTRDIKFLLNKAVEDGMTDKIEIITVVSDKLKCPRATVRRAKKELLEELKHKTKVLE